MNSTLLVAILTDHVYESGELAALWPTSRQLSPKIRAFVDFLADRLDLDGNQASASEQIKSIRSYR